MEKSQDLQGAHDCFGPRKQSPFRRHDMGAQTHADDSYTRWRSGLGFIPGETGPGIHLMAKKKKRLCEQSIKHLFVGSLRIHDRHG
jgi:hypothetical protein